MCLITVSSEHRLLQRGLCWLTGVAASARAGACGLCGLYTETDSFCFVLLVVPDVYLFQSDQEEPDLVSALWGLCVNMEGSPCLVPPRPGLARAGWAARCWPGPGGERGTGLWWGAWCWPGLSGEHGAGQAPMGHTVPSSGLQTHE